MWLGWKVLKSERWDAGQQEFSQLPTETQEMVLRRFRGKYGTGAQGRAKEQKAGIKLLAGWWYKNYTRSDALFIEHSLEVSNFHAALELAVARVPGLKLLEWRQGNVLEAKVKWEVDVMEKALVVAPDAYGAV